MPTDHEFSAGELSLIVDDYNPGCDCLCLPGCYKRLTLTAKVMLQVDSLPCCLDKFKQLMLIKLLSMTPTLCCQAVAIDQLVSVKPQGFPH